MRSAGQVVLFRFPQADLEAAKLRPALLLGQFPGPYNDWLIAMVSTQLRQTIQGFDEVIQPNDPDFNASGLKTASVIRTGRLAVVEGELLIGAIGQISPTRLQRIKQNLADWLMRAPESGV